MLSVRCMLIPLILKTIAYRSTDYYEVEGYKQLIYETHVWFRLLSIKVCYHNDNACWYCLLGEFIMWVYYILFINLSQASKLFDMAYQSY